MQACFLRKIGRKVWAESFKPPWNRAHLTTKKPIIALFSRPSSGSWEVLESFVETNWTTVSRPGGKPTWLRRMADLSSSRLPSDPRRSGALVVDLIRCKQVREAMHAVADRVVQGRIVLKTR